MDIDRFRKLLNDPRRTRKDLEQMRRNALDKGEIEAAHAAKFVLDERFCGWDRTRSKVGGATPTLATFKGRNEFFDTAKDAYVWLLNCFISDKPEILEREDWRAEFLVTGRAVKYFSRDLKSLFEKSPHLADNPNFYTILGKGWFANLNLSNDQKLEILCRFSVLAGYKIKEDWNWEVQER